MRRLSPSAAYAMHAAANVVSSVRRLGGTNTCRRAAAATAMNVLANCRCWLHEQAGQSLRLRRLRRARQAKSNFKPMRCPNGYSYSITSRDLTGRLLSTYPTMPNTFSCDFGLLKRSASSKVTTCQKVRRASSRRALSAATISARQAGACSNGWSYSCGTPE